MKSKKTNKTITIIISLLVISVLGVSLSFALLKDEAGTLINNFKPADIDTEIEENNNGADLSKAPSVKIGEKFKTDSIVRMHLSISNVDEFEQYFGLKGIDTKEDNSGIKVNDEGTYWIKDSNSDNRYDSYYYYMGILSLDSNEGSTSTSPLFSQILYHKDENTYVPFFVEDTENPGTYIINEETGLNSEKAKKILSVLSNIEITIYQETMPEEFSIGETKYDADSNDDGIVDNIGNALNIWNYFDTVQN